MGLYDQALALNAQGQNTALGLRQQGLNQPSAIERFMSGLKSGQEGLRQQKASALQEMLLRARQAEAEKKAKQEQEEYEYGISQRPLKEQGTLTDILFKQKQAEQMGRTPTEQPMSQYQRESLDIQRQRLNKPTGGGSAYDKSSIPGTAEWARVQKYQEGSNKQEYALEAGLAQMDRLKEEALRLKNHPGLERVTGITGAFPDIPGGDAANARAQFETLKSQVGFNVLQSLREMSKTGGALGQVSDKEEAMLQNNLAALQSSQSMESLQAALDRIVAFTESSKARLQGAYANQGSAQPEASPLQKVLKPQARPGGRVKINNAAEYNNLPSGTPYIDPNGVPRVKK